VSYFARIMINDNWRHVSEKDHQDLNVRFTIISVKRTQHPSFSPSQLIRKSSTNFITTSPIATLQNRAIRALTHVTKWDLSCIVSNICSTVVYFDLLTPPVNNNQAIDRLFYVQPVHFLYSFPFCGTSVRIPVMVSPFTKLPDITQIQNTW